MSLNLHAVVRGAINAVNPDMTGTWKQSTGFTTAAGGRTTPTYATVSGVPMQVQALSGRDLQHTNFLAQQGVKRAVYMYGNGQGINRPNAKGGDLLLFPEARGGANETWLVAEVFETWGPDATGFCKVGVILQPDATP